MSLKYASILLAGAKEMRRRPLSSPTNAHACGTLRGASKESPLPKFEAIGIDLNDVVPFDYVEIFLFVVMEMPRRSTFLMIILLHYKQVSAGLVAEHFKSCVAYSNVVPLIEAVLAGRDLCSLGFFWCHLRPSLDWNDRPHT